MSQNFNKQKRVVSKIEYLGHLGKQATLFSSGTLVFLLGAMGVAIGLILLVGILLMGLMQWADDPGTEVSVILMGLLACCIASGISLLICKLGIGMMDSAEELEPVVPFTRDAADQFAAEESLVRASSEPALPPEEVLLRAAASGSETPAEQLLRAAADAERVAPNRAGTYPQTRAGSRQAPHNLV
ncbi:MAG TPA: hypothetical protein VFB21_23640 [Chthonomonadaceae bacterium]|nr:hypothetical protein [Chthonomonadaceae bacterium]